MFLHTTHSTAAGYRAVAITSENTDVFFLSLALKASSHALCLPNAVNRLEKHT